MPLIGRRHAAAPLRAELHLARDERVLMRVDSGNGLAVVATDRALYSRASIAGWTRRGWDEIVRLDADDFGTVPPRTRNRLLALAHERIGATRVIVTRIVIDGRELTVEGRRQPASGELRWFVHPGTDVDANDAAFVAQLDAALMELRAVLGV
jgi:hypothetical protein